MMAQVSDASERQIAHMRAQAATASGQHVEALCKAQDICSQAEARADAADRSGLTSNHLSLLQSRHRALLRSHCDQQLQMD